MRKVGLVRPIQAYALGFLTLAGCGIERVVDLPTPIPTPSPLPSSWIRSWQLMENSGTDLTIGIHMADRACERLADVRVRESAEEVAIEAFGARVPGNRVCTMALVLRRYTVTLERPLGDRTLTGCIAEGRPPLPDDCSHISR